MIRTWWKLIKLEIEHGTNYANTAASENKQLLSFPINQNIVCSLTLTCRKCHFNWEQVIWRNQIKYAELEVRNQLFCVCDAFIYCFTLPLILFKQHTLTSYHNILRKPIYSSVNVPRHHCRVLQRINVNDKIVRQALSTWTWTWKLSHYRDWSQYAHYRAEMRPRDARGDNDYLAAQ